MVKGGKGIVVGSQPASMGIGSSGGDQKLIMSNGESKTVKRERDSRFNADSITLEDATGGSDIYGAEYFKKLQSLLGSDDVDDVKGDSGSKDKKSMTSYVEGLSKLTLEDNQVCKVVPERVYSVAIHPGSTLENPICALVRYIFHTHFLCCALYFELNSHYNDIYRVIIGDVIVITGG